MKIHITKKYYSRVRHGEEPIRYTARQPKGIGTDVYATIWLDPILKKHPDLQKTLLKHEVEEIEAWGKGSSSAHMRARAREPKGLQKLGGVGGFWREIKRRERK